ncbi:hypothetical protein GCM10010486_31590 [Nonomuraea roseoviolacea subsp. carminata]|uniref:Transposase IS701-like DDE domain-containing protein n=1 Tax=Nonomuraea roseoviolacea subsp. carminata TaxID=160689 RepID=A0ABT1KAX9_9ACTN|nr:hypothetical protein [Nonomuraea roseoviolacea subsp. carminata]
MLAALKAGVPARWMTGDEIYGQDSRLRAADARPGSPDSHRRRPAAQRRRRDRIPLTLPEIRRLLTTLVLTTHRSITDILRWSDWRRRHQASTRRCHYQRRSEQ